MPTYDYECSSCGERFEQWRSINENVSSSKCPKCKRKSTRIFTTVPVIFKGAGFYVTDHRKAESAETDTPAAIPAPKPEPKKETKPVAAKTEVK